ncbi:MAG TPA: sigma-70 family RNA polymerase sigma factor [Gemmatimonadaceae bacterium]|nr:sigma-70 family RNA polymerase sigma factor [Gemmatimonadaceae bacterium]
MADEARTRVTQLLAELADGNAAAMDGLFSLLYDELRSIAHRQRRRWHGDHTMQTTVLVHEAFLKLVDQDRIPAESRAHFLAVVARAMRHILCNYARDRGAQKRGGAMEHVALDESRDDAAAADSTSEPAEVLVALDEALARLERIDPRQSGVVECRFFGGLTIEETASALGVSPRTVKRDWAMAQAWLHREMTAEREGR